MRHPNLLKITGADFIVRAGYQMGKTPLLPLFAAALGASDLLLGTIISVSTLTGMLAKPLFGFLSDRQGRRGWLALGVFFFALFPFLYRFVETPGQLVLIRILHGTATAIFGPVTVAYVAEQGGSRKAEQLGWFGMARSGGYIVGPVVAGWLLLWLEPAAVFTMIGLISLIAFVPILWLSESDTIAENDPAPVPSPTTSHQPPTANLHTALVASLHTPGVWLSGSMDAMVYMATYAIKAFLPVYALTAGYSTVEIGLFFSVQEGAHLLLKPLGGWVGDHLGHYRAVALGMAGVALTLPLLAMANGGWGLMVLSVGMGAAQALIFPSTTALVAEQIAPNHVGTGMGVIGSLDNAGKVAGPILGGLLITGMGYGLMLRFLGVFLLLGAVGVWMAAPSRK